MIKPGTPMYIIDGNAETRVPIPPGHVIVALAAGVAPRALPFNSTHGALTIDPSPGAQHPALPLLLLVVPDGEAAWWIRLTQRAADDLHGAVLSEWARAVSLGSG